MKTYIYNKVLQAVSEVTGISPAEILSHKKLAEIVEARSLLIYYLYREELSPLQIATLSGFTRQCVEATRLRFPDKDSRSKWLNNLMQHIDNILVSAVSEWLGKVATSVLPKIGVPPTSTIGKMMQGFFGINPAQYNIWNELGFLLNPTIQSFVEPKLRQFLSAIPEDKVKDVAMQYADALITQAQEKGAVNVFGIQIGQNAFEGLKEILNEKFNNNLL